MARHLSLVFLCVLLGGVDAQGGQRELTPQETLDYNLIRAAISGDKKETKKLLKQGADVNFAYPYELSAVIDARMPSPKGSGITPLMLAAFYGRHKVVKIMLKAGARIDTKNSIHSNALILATMGNKKKVVEALVKAGADVNTEDEAGMTPFDWADDQGNEKIMAILVSATAGGKEEL